MAKSYNMIQLVGRVGTDPETRTFNSGTQKTSIRLAVGRVVKGEEKTDWFSVVFWGKSSEIADRYLRKGDLLMVSGRMESSQWQANDGAKRESWEVNCQNFVMMDSRSRDDESGGYSAGKPRTSQGYNEPSNRYGGGTGGGYKPGSGQYGGGGSNGGSGGDDGWGDDVPF